MPLFIYTARTKEGRIESGSLEAKDQDILLAMLQERGLLVTSIVQATREELVSRTFGRKKHYHYGVRLDDLILLARQLATLLDAGVPLLRSLTVVSDQIESHTLDKVLYLVRKEVEAGKALSEALKRHPKIFSPFWVNLVQTGEASGQLPFVFDQIAKYLEEAGALRRKVISALVYPAILTLIAFSTLAIFIGRIIPIFERIFNEFQVELPFLTSLIIKISSLLRRYFLLEILGVIAIIFAVRKFSQKEEGRWLLDRWKLKLPLFGNLFLMVALERFASAFSVLIKSGVPILYALEIVQKASGNKLIESALEKVKDAVRAGQSMSRPMAESGVFPPIVIEMVEVGEEAGEVANMLYRLGLFYKERIDAFVSRFTVAFEPVVLIFMGTIIGVIVIAMFLPIFGLASAIKIAP
ncbi:MAG: type II secretion system F family protein [Candidatus Omnitrophica bacterium]|nr:type II secretion system F family protein [Candidatus Omnitrophota bacterium]